MTTIELIGLIKLLSAIESWAMSQKEPLPDYLHDDISEALTNLTDQILKKVPQ